MNKMLWALVDDESCEIVGVFPTEEDATNCLYYCKNWKKRFEKHFGVSFSNIKEFTIEMAEWFDCNFNDLDRHLVIHQVKYYENFS